MIRFRVLGEVGITAPDGSFVAAPTGMVATLLSTIVLDAGQSFSRRHLIDHLWDEPPPSAEANLRKYLQAVRHLLTLTNLRDRLLLSRARNGTYRLAASHDEVDAHAFLGLAATGRAQFDGGDLASASRSLRSALALWRGEVCAGARPSRRLEMRLRGLMERRWAAYEEALAAALRLGTSPAVVAAEARALIAEAPLREGAWRLLIRAQHLTGDVDGALRSFRELTAVLDQELGVRPSPETHALVQAILRDEPSSSPSV